MRAMQNGIAIMKTRIPQFTTEQFLMIVIIFYI